MAMFGTGGIGFNRQVNPLFGTDMLSSITPESLAGFGASPVGGYGAVSPMAAGGIMPSGLGGSGLGMNLGTAQLGLSGLGAIGNLFGAFQAASLAKKQFKYTKDITETNLGNQIKSYNTALDDKITSRAAVQGMSSTDVEAYKKLNALTRR